MPKARRMSPTDKPSPVTNLKSWECPRFSADQSEQRCVHDRGRCAAWLRRHDAGWLIAGCLHPHRVGAASHRRALDDEGRGRLVAAIDWQAEAGHEPGASARYSGEYIST